MERISDIELRDESVYPGEAVLARVLGPSFSSYQRMLALFDSHGLTYGWRYYKDGKAWLCKVHLKTRTIAWMSARYRLQDRLQIAGEDAATAFARTSFSVEIDFSLAAGLQMP